MRNALAFTALLVAGATSALLAQTPAPTPVPPAPPAPPTMPAPGSAAPATTPAQSPTTFMDLVRQRNLSLLQGIELNPTQRSAIDSMVNQHFGTAPVGAADTAAAARQMSNLNQLDARIRALLDSSQQKTWVTNLQKYQAKPAARP